MEEEAIVRIVFDAIRLADMDVTKIDISKQMMVDVGQSRAAINCIQQCSPTQERQAVRGRKTYEWGQKKSPW